MKSVVFFLLIAIICLPNTDVFAQGEDHVTFEEIYDEPENINKLFIGFQPIIGELWATNPTMGFGIDATYYLNNVAHFHTNIRKAYIDQFDLAMWGALSNSDMQNDPEVFNHYEIGGAYHFKDDTKDSQTKMILYRRSYKGNKWSSRVPLQATIPSKLRMVYAARGGLMYFDTSVDLNRVIDRQGLTFDDIVTAEGNALQRFYTNAAGVEEEIRAFSSLRAFGGYLGASLSWIRNVAVDFDEYEAVVDDQILTAFFDILILPALNLENLFYQDQEYIVDPIDTVPIGFRLGIDGKFNRTLGWGYGGDIGFKPGLGKGGFSALLRVTIPMYSTNLENSVEAFGK